MDMKKISCALAILIALLFTSSVQAQIDIAVTGVTPLSNVRLTMGTYEPVRVVVRNLSSTVSNEVKVKATIRTYTNILLFADSTVLPGLAAHSTDTVELADFVVTESGYYAVLANASTSIDVNDANNSFSNPRVGYQSDVGITSIVSPYLDESKLQKTSFTFKGRFKSTVLEAQEVDVRARVQVRRCFDNALVFQADSYIPELPKDTVTVLFEFPSAQGIYDVRKLDPGCYKLAMMTRKTADFNFKNDTLYSTFNIQPNVLPNDVMIDSVNAMKDKMIKPGESLPLSFMFGNVGKNVQPSAMVHVVIKDEGNLEVYHQQATLNNWLVGESRTQSFLPFSTQTGGVYRLQAYTALTNDEFRFNDTLTRSIAVEKAFAFKIDSLLLPVPGQLFEVASEFTPRTLISWTGNAVPSGNINATLTITKAYGPKYPEASATVPITGIATESGTVELEFPLNGKTKLFTRDNYEANLLLFVDGNPVDGVDPVPFRMAYAHDVRIDSLISPNYYDSYPLGPVQVAHRVENKGMNDEPNVMLEAWIFDKDSVELYQESIETSIEVKSHQIMALPSFMPPRKGMYSVKFRLSVPYETDTSDNNLIANPFHVGSPHEASMVRAEKPRANEVFKRGELFSPAAVLETYEVDQVMTPIALEVSIRKCGTGEEVFRQSGSGQPPQFFGSRLITFYSNSSTDNRPTSELEVGCYDAVFIATRPEDDDRSDDTLIVPFSIEEQSVVRGSSSAQFAIKDLSLDGNILKATLVAHTIHLFSYAIYDIRGEQVMSGIAQSTDTHIGVVLPVMPSGTYIFELKQGDKIDREIFHYIK